MPKAWTYNDELAWWFTTQQIGWALRKRYQVSRELPSELLALVRKLDEGEDNLRADNSSHSDLGYVEAAEVLSFQTS
jgi:hypothetical protein